MHQIILEPEPKLLNAWSWNLQFQSRLHNPDFQTLKLHIGFVKNSWNKMNRTARFLNT